MGKNLSRKRSAGSVQPTPQWLTDRYAIQREETPPFIEAIAYARAHELGPREEEQIQRLSELLSEGQEDINEMNDVGDTALTWCVTCRPEIIQFLLDSGADVNHINDNGETLLFKAARWNKPDIVRILLATPGIHGNEITYSSQSAIDVAANEEIRELIRNHLNSTRGGRKTKKSKKAKKTKKTKKTTKRRRQ